jgi:cellobiose phosphorylase
MKSSKSKDLSWWKFIGRDEAFEARNPDQISRLYFPLCNEAGLLSAVTPRLHGDIKTGQNHFLTLPLSVEDLHNTRSARNFWVLMDGKEPWSATGNSAAAERERITSPEKCKIQAGALWHRMRRENRKAGLSADVLNFVPVGSDLVEVMQITLTNTGRRPVRITPTSAIPIFGRSADNLRDHRHVTSLLHRITPHPHGVLVKPTMTFDERGHTLNDTIYAVVGLEDDGDAPLGSFPTAACFTGEGGSFDAPRAVLEDWDVPDLSDAQMQGREAVGALRFKTRKLGLHKSVTYTILMGIASDRKDIDRWLKRFSSGEKVNAALEETKVWWKERLDAVRLETDDADFNSWLRWVTLQPMLRSIFGCSFLPDFDYGRGGRGWRDLWQDCLALLLLDTSTENTAKSIGPRDSALDPSVRQLLLNNFAGVRISGANATIIGKKPGEFIADRNNLSRTWMDHGVWPWLTTELYIHQTGDWRILLEEVPYFWDRDTVNAEYGVRSGEAGKLHQEQPSSASRIPQSELPFGTVFEHILVQHLTSFFNVGDNGNIRLEDADWNDGLDMAHDRGESVAFTSVYAGNLLRLADLLEVLQARGVQQLPVTEELLQLSEAFGASTELTPEQKRKRLATYHEKCRAGISGEKRSVAVSALINDLRLKGEALAEQVRAHEWISHKSGHSWFNGYYDNNGHRVEGENQGNVRMTLTGQVFPIMSGVATEEQVERAFLAAKRFLQDRRLGGFRLNTNFGDIQPALGRAFSFAYGEKENGAFFSHMIVMFSNALYQRGFAKEGFEVLDSLYQMCGNADTAKIYPGLPEYFNGEGRGMYHYLTGSASWLLFTMITQVAGIRGKWGDLLLAPKLMPAQFGKSGQVTAHVGFAGKRLKITFMNRNKRPYGKYRIESVLLQGRSLEVPGNTTEMTVPRQALINISNKEIDITVALS